jgi:hypothetical protein
MTPDEEVHRRWPNMVTGKRVVHETEGGSRIIVFELSEEAKRALVVPNAPEPLPIARIASPWWRRLLSAWRLRHFCKACACPKIRSDWDRRRYCEKWLNGAECPRSWFR